MSEPQLTTGKKTAEFIKSYESYTTKQRNGERTRVPSAGSCFKELIKLNPKVDENECWNFIRDIRR